MKQYSCFLIRPTSAVADLVVVDACDDQQARETVAAILRRDASYTVAEVYDDEMHLFELPQPRLGADFALPAA